MDHDSLAGKTVLVTGGAGFIGSHLVDELVPKNDVRIIDNFSSGKRTNVNEEAELIEADIRDDRALDRATENVDVIFHQAGVVSVTESVEAPVDANDVNIDATVALLERARAEDARVVVASSCAIYGHPSTTPIPESEPTAPTSPYGLQKLTIDHYAQLYHELYGLKSVALRYFNVYGPRQSSGDYSGVISIFNRQASNGESITVDGDGEQTRDFIHVSDIVRANILAATTEDVGESYNIGTGESVTINDIATEISDIHCTDSDIIHTDARTGDIRHSEAEISKAREKLGFDPSVSLEDGLQRLVQQKSSLEN